MCQMACGYIRFYWGCSECSSTWLPRPSSTKARQRARQDSENAGERKLADHQRRLKDTLDSS